MGIGGGPSLLIRVEKEELALRSHIEHIAHAGGLLNRPLQHIPGIPRKCGPVRIIHIADQPCHLALLGPPREYLKGIQVRVQVHVGLVNPYKSLNGGAVKHAAVIQRLPKLAGSNGHILKHTKNIRELKADELHILFLHHADNVVLTVFAHLYSPSLANCNTNHVDP